MLASVTALAGCGGPGVPTLEGGWDAYGAASHITCTRARPVLLKGYHMDLAVDGPCSNVVVAGDHNDISVTLAAGGRIEITGMHNDVTWSLLPGAGGAPSLLNHGPSNSFHAGG